MPQTNRGFWERKLRRNRERDQQVDQVLANAGWTVIHIWEHEQPEMAALQIAEIVRSSVRSRATNARSPGRVAR